MPAAARATFEDDRPMQIEQAPTVKPYEKPEGERRGLVLVNTGDGKGKSTAAFGLALRAHGRGKSVKIFQFMKVPTARFGEHRMRSEEHTSELQSPCKSRMPSSA